MLISHYLKNAIIISFLAKSTFEFPFPRAMFVKCGIIVALILKIYKKVFRILIGKRLFGNLSVNRKVDLLNETLLNIFRNYIPNKKIKFNYCQPPWMNDNIKRCLKERSKLSKMHRANNES